MTKRVDKDHLDKAHDYGIHVPSASIWLGEGEDGIDRQTLVRLAKNLLILESAGKPQITVYLNTPGGDVQQALGIYDLLKGANAHITIIGYGSIESAGTVVLQAGDHRAVSRNSLVMYHHGTTEIPEMPTGEYNNYHRYGRKLDDRADEVVRLNIGVTKRKFARMIHNGMYCTADEALAAGLIDEVL